MDKNKFDVIIAGAGLAGLMAGLILQSQGMQVLMLEKREQAGGLCGTQVIDGYEFSIACNDFGSGFRTALEKAGIAYPFLKATTVFHFEHTSLRLPPDLATVFKLVPHTLDLVRFGTGLKKYTFLGEAMERSIRSGKLRNVVSMLAYALAMPPSDVRIDALKEGMSKRFNYGYEKSMIPKGGPERLIAAMVKYFTSMGGNLHLEEEFLSQERTEDGRKVHTSRGVYDCRFLVSSQPRWDKYREGMKESLPISMIYVALKSAFEFPAGITTLADLPGNVEVWMDMLDQGKLPEKFGFHITKSDLRNLGYYTVTINFLSPRGYDKWPELPRRQAMDYVLSRAETLLPGFNDAILHKKFISPREFEKLYGRSSQNFKYVLREGEGKPDIYDPGEDMYYIGNAVYPPGEHAGGAVLSALYATEMLLKDRQQQTVLSEAEMAPEDL